MWIPIRDGWIRIRDAWIRTSLLHVLQPVPYLIPRGTSVRIAPGVPCLDDGSALAPVGRTDRRRSIQFSPFLME